MGLTTETPGELLCRARKGDALAWAALVERYTGLLWSIARSYDLGEADAGDVVQTTWLRLVERMETIRDPEAVRGWLAAIARRESLRAARRPAGRPMYEPAAAAVPPDEVALARERFGQVAAALRELPDRCRALLRLFAQEPMTYAELAAVLDIPIGSIGPTRARCLDNLRRRLP